MNEQQAISKMVRPSAPKGNWGGVIQILVTNACDLACPNCTQASHVRRKATFMSVEHFEEAVVNLKDYHGIAGVFGGNPALHPKFETLCEIFRKHIPFHRRGIWCNHPHGHGSIMRDTFNPTRSNLNVHGVQSAYDEFVKDWPQSHPFGLEGSDSRHAPVWVSPLDWDHLPRGIANTEENRYDYIAGCDVGLNWSALYGEFRGQLRFWFCEVAGAQAILNQNKPDYPDTGHPVTPRCWDEPMSAYVEQVRQHCHRCAVPYNGYGEIATKRDGYDQVSAEYEGLCRPKYPERLVQLVTSPEEMRAEALECVTHYVQNAMK